MEASQFISSLREEEWNKKTKDYFVNHPILRETRKEIISKAFKIFTLEQYYGAKKDCESMEILEEHYDYSLIGLYFKNILQSERIINGLLKELTRTIGISKETIESYSPLEGGQAYAEYLRKLVEERKAEAIAVAFTINFPICGRMYVKFREVLMKCLDMSESDTRLLDYFNSDSLLFDSYVVDILQEGLDKGLSKDEVREVVQGLQQLEVKFWDTVYSASLDKKSSE